MNRFQNLEFSDEAGEEAAANAPLVKDEAYYLAQAQAAFESGRFDSGLRAYARVLEHNPKNTTAWCGQVRMLIELGEYHEAKVWADKALESFPSDPELLAAKGVALARSGDLRAALAFSDAAIEERGDTPYVWLARADVLLAHHERKADFCLDRALALASFHWFHLWLASRVYAFHRQFARALQLAQRALEVASDRAVVWFQLGTCQLMLGLAGPAHNCFEQARQLDPDAPALRDAPLAPPGLGARLRGLWWRLVRR